MNNLQIIHGHAVIELDSVESTNNYAATMLKSGKPSEGTVILSHYQSGGKGQRGSVWLSNPSQNLTFSLITYPSFLTGQQLYTLTKITALAVRAFIEDIVEQEAFIKWPNDILVNHAKISGILLENGVMGQIVTSCITGIGINVNQSEFGVLNATSLAKETGKSYTLTPLLGKFLPYFDRYFNLIKRGKSHEVDEEYLKWLYRLNVSSNFRVGTRSFSGIIRGVNTSGQLMVESERGIERFDVKEISLEIPT